jgi:hypothetical protein
MGAPVQVDSPKFFPIHGCGFAFTSLRFSDGKVRVVTTLCLITSSEHFTYCKLYIFIRAISWTLPWASMKNILAHKVEGIDLEYTQKMVWITQEWRKKFIRFCNVFKSARGMWFLCGHVFQWDAYIWVWYGHPKDMYHNENWIMCPNTITHSRFNREHNWEGLYGHLGGLHLVSLLLCNLNSYFKIFVVHYC